MSEPIWRDSEGKPGLGEVFQVLECIDCDIRDRCPLQGGLRHAGYRACELLEIDWEDSFVSRHYSQMVMQDAAREVSLFRQIFGRSPIVRGEP